jgi:hypothetical protein
MSLPLLPKLLFTAFMAVLVPKYWMDYGPTNFLYFCDVALFFTLAALWLESPLLAATPLVGILLPQILWQVDFVAGLFGYQVTGMTGYMFDETIPLFTRGLSFFHFWLPLFLLWMVGRLGYDRRAFAVWTVLATVLLFVCYFLMPAPPPPADNPNKPVNINYVYGMNDDKPQEWMPPLAWFGLLLVGLPVIVFLPTHLLLRFCFRDPGTTCAGANTGPRNGGTP